MSVVGVRLSLCLSDATKKQRWPIYSSQDDMRSVRTWGIRWWPQRPSLSHTVLPQVHLALNISLQRSLGPCPSPQRPSLIVPPLPEKVQSKCKPRWARWSLVSWRRGGDVHPPVCKAKRSEDGWLHNPENVLNAPWLRW